MKNMTRPRGLPAHFIMVMMLSLAGCATLPSSGPSGRAIKLAQNSPQNTVGFQIVELRDTQSIPAAASQGSQTYLPPPPPERQSINMIGIGDGLQIVIYEVGVALFSGPATFGSPPQGTDPSVAKVGSLPPIVVDETGYISVPYAGRLHAAGMTTYDLQRLIASKLAKKSQDPQVLVSINDRVANAVIVGGEIEKPGRLHLATGKETLLDAVALAGGYKGDPYDLVVRLDRAGSVIEERVSRLTRSPVGAVRVAGGDAIQILRQPLSFSAFGGPSKIDLFPFGKDDLSLAEAVARAGGSSQYAGDPKAIFVFRYVNEPEGIKPTIYHLNMMKAQAYFLAQRFQMQDRDVLYIGNAEANQPSKLIQIIGQIFTPLALARTATQ